MRDQGGWCFKCDVPNKWLHCTSATVIALEPKERHRICPILTARYLNETKKLLELQFHQPMEA